MSRFIFNGIAKVVNNLDKHIVYSGEKRSIYRKVGWCN